MKSKFTALTVALAMAMTWPLSNASAGEGLYLNVHVAGPVPQRTNASLSGALISRGSYNYSFGLGAGAAVGWAFPEAHPFSGFRLELEAEYFLATPKKYKAKSGTFAGGPAVNASGNFHHYFFFANLYYDIHEFEDILPLPVTPYVGLGVGGGIIRLATVTLPFNASYEDTTSVFVAQVIVGLSYKIMQNLAVGGEYRFVRASDPTFSDRPPGGAVRVKGQSRRHMFGLSLRYYLNLM